MDQETLEVLLASLATTRAGQERAVSEAVSHTASVGAEHDRAKLAQAAAETELGKTVAAIRGVELAMQHTAHGEAGTDAGA